MEVEGGEQVSPEMWATPLAVATTASDPRSCSPTGCLSGPTTKEVSTVHFRMFLGPVK